MAPPSTPAITLEKPRLELLAGYREALERGWSPDNVGLEKTARAHLAAIAEDPAAFVERLTDREGKAGDVVLPDGTRAKRLPGYAQWIWDGEFCGQIGFRWQPGAGAELPPHVLGHIGYAVVPWKRGRGYATEALRLLLPMARAEGLPFVALTCEPDNLASQKTILANGGRLVERGARPAAYGGGEILRFVIEL